jgi:hypothetical protein
MSEDWIESIKKAVLYKIDALEFLTRVREQFQYSNPTHAAIVAKLWTVADDMDQIINNYLLEMNNYLLSDEGEIEITRGASMQPNSQSKIDDSNDMTLGQMNPYGGERLVYECTWSLTWANGNDEHTIACRLIAETSDGELRTLVNGLHFPENYEIAYPLIESELKDALAKAYIEEATVKKTKDIIQKILDLEQQPNLESTQNSNI